MSGSITTIFFSPNLSPITTTTTRLPASLISHQISSRFLIGFLRRDLPSDVFSIAHSGFNSCSDFSSENHRSAVETRSGSVIVRNALSQFLSCGSPARVFLGKSDLRSDFICCCNRGCLATARRGKHRIRRVHEVLSSGAAAT